jgi:hypothetical protein
MQRPRPRGQGRRGAVVVVPVAVVDDVAAAHPERLVRETVGVDPLLESVS